MQPARARPARKGRRGRTAAHGDHLGDDADRDLLRRLGGDREADRRAHLGERRGRRPLIARPRQHRRHLAAAADQAHVAGLPPDGVPQRHEIGAVAAGQNGDERPARHLRQDAREIVRDAHAPHARREAGGLEVARPVVHHGHLESQPRAEVGHLAAHVPRAEHQQGIGRTDHLDEDAGAAAAHHPQGVRALFGEAVFLLDPPALADRLAGVLDDQGLEGAPPDAEDRLALLGDDHLGPEVTRRRALAADDRRHGDGAAGAQQPDHLFVEDEVHRAAWCAPLRAHQRDKASALGPSDCPVSIRSACRAASRGA